ncbi:hypothetical protein Dimus_002836, partial [Dionaea muscipula]
RRHHHLQHHCRLALSPPANTVAADQQISPITAADLTYRRRRRTHPSSKPISTLNRLRESSRRSRPPPPPPPQISHIVVVDLTHSHRRHHRRQSHPILTPSRSALLIQRSSHRTKALISQVGFVAPVVG